MTANTPHTEPKFAKLLRIVTAPPLVVLCAFTLMWRLGDQVFLTGWHYAIWVLCIGLLPLLAYPVSWIPPLRKKGRKFQRRLAVILSVIGYAVCGGVALLHLSSCSKWERLIAYSYLLSGVCIAICSLLHFPISGHAAGVTGPALLLCITLSWWWLPVFAVYGAVIYASLATKRHTLPELLWGGVTPVLWILLFLLVL